MRTIDPLRLEVTLTHPAAAFAAMTALEGMSEQPPHARGQLVVLGVPARAGAVTGATLLFGYAGLALAPMGFAAAGGAFGTSLAFASLLAATAAVGARLLLPGRGPA